MAWDNYMTMAVENPEYINLLPETEGWGEFRKVMDINGTLRMTVPDTGGKKIGHRDIVNAQLIRGPDNQYYVLPPEGSAIPWYKIRPFVPAKTLKKIENKLDSLKRDKKRKLEE